MSTQIPDSHRDLVDGKVYPTVATVLPDGQPHLTVVWYSYDGTHILVNVVKGHQKDENLRRDPHISFLAIDPQNPFRYLEIRGKVAEIIEGEGALQNLNDHAKKYTGKNTYYGEVRPAELRHQEERVLYKITPTKVNVFGQS